MLKARYCFLFLLCLTACSATRTTPSGYEGDRLSAGSVGGVSGAIRECLLFRNGQTFLNKGITGDYTPMPDMKSSDVKAFFRRAEEMGLDTLKLSAPGNMTYFLKYVRNGKTNEIRWGGRDVPVPAQVMKLYNDLINHF